MPSPDHINDSATLPAWAARVAGAAVAQFAPYAGMLLGLSATMLIWVGAFYFIGGERRQTELAAFQNSSNLTRAFEEHIIRSIRAVDQTLLYVRDSYSTDPERFNISLWARNNQSSADFAFQISIIDKNGILVASSINAEAAPIDLSDREHFKIHTQRKSDELFISKPVLGRVSGRWSLQLTRRINGADGTFDGVVVVSLDLDYLDRFYESIDVGEHGTVTLVGTDGVIRARSPGDEAIGNMIDRDTIFDRLAVEQAGAAYDRSPIDGVVRMLSFRQVKGYPLVVIVGLDRDEMFRLFEHNRRNYLATAGLLSIWLLAMTMVIWRYQRGLTKARDAAQSGIRARSEFLAMMSHEIRTPMNGVIGMAELLLDSGLHDEQAVLANTLRNSAGYLLQQINDVLDFSKLDADRVELEKIPFDVRDLVQGAVDVLTPSAEAKSIYCVAKVASSVPSHVMGDPSRVRQVLFNLVGNAIKFTQQGGVTVIVDADVVEGGKLTRLIFRVRDTGIGIPADAVGLLFREFSQLDNSISRRFGGTGLGLAICKRLVALMGGEIGIDSTIGRGSEFHFSIDVAAVAAPPTALTPSVGERPASALPALSGDQPFQPGTLRILVAEDNQTNRLVIRKHLCALGQDAEIAGNGVEAVAAAATRPYDLIFMDVMMPEMDGLTATKAIRDRPGPNRRTRIVALTANAFPEDREKCHAAGMDGFLAKPVTRKDLVAILQSVVPLAATAAAAPTIGHHEVGELFDTSIYDALKEALGVDDASMVLRIFLDDARQRLDVIAGAASRGDNQAIMRESHALKSAAATVGFVRLSQLAGRIEVDARSAIAPIPPATVSALSDAFQLVVTFAQDHILSAEIAPA